MHTLVTRPGRSTSMIPPLASNSSSSPAMLSLNRSDHSIQAHNRQPIATLAASKRTILVDSCRPSFTPLIPPTTTAHVSANVLRAATSSQLLSTELSAGAATIDQRPSSLMTIAISHAQETATRSAVAMVSTVTALSYQHLVTSPAGMATQPTLLALMSILERSAFRVLAATQKAQACGRSVFSQIPTTQSSAVLVLALAISIPVSSMAGSASAATVSVQAR
jgi:hypothetical protein